MNSAKLTPSRPIAARICSAWLASRENSGIRTCTPPFYACGFAPKLRAYRPASGTLATQDPMGKTEEVEPMTTIHPCPGCGNVAVEQFCLRCESDALGDGWNAAWDKHGYTLEL